MSQTTTSFSTASQKPILVKEDTINKYSQFLTEDDENISPPPKEDPVEVGRVIVTQSRVGVQRVETVKSYEEEYDGEEEEVYDDADPSLNYEETDDYELPCQTYKASNQNQSRKRHFPQEDEEESETEAEFMEKRESEYY